MGAKGERAKCRSGTWEKIGKAPLILAVVFAAFDSSSVVGVSSRFVDGSSLGHCGHAIRFHLRTKSV